MEGFVEELARATHTLLLPIYPARELPIEGVESEKIAERIPQAEVVQKGELTEKLKALQPEVVLMVGAGDIGDLVGTVKAELA